MKKFLLLIAIVFSGITSSYASHVMGGDITYVHISGNDYEVTLTLYRDCAGSTLPTTFQQVDFTSSCGNQSPNLPWIATNDVSQVCPGQTTTCTGGVIPGTQQYVYRGIVTLIPCADWIIGWDLCCRNNAITNLATTPSMYLQTTLNNVIGAFNNSPQFFNVPTPYLCVNQLAIYSHAASDVDGDSLYYEFNNPLTTPGPPGTPIAFAPGYSLLQPMITTNGMNLDSLTGEMCFVPSQVQISVVALIISEYRNGLLIGTQIREMQVIVDATCTNQNPTVGTSATCGGTGGMTITVAGPSVDSVDQNSVKMCPNDSVCLQIVFSDPDPLDNITVMDNIATAIPGATWTVVNNNTPNPVGTFCWVPTPLDSGTNVFSIILLDDACPISGTQTFTYDITVFDQPYAGPDQIICGTQTAQLQASGGATYTWFDAATNIQVPVGPAFSCNPCINPIAFPPVTTNYYVLSSLTAACENTDTVSVIVVPDFIPQTIDDTVLCGFITHQLGVNILSGPVGTYSYLWSNGATLSNDTLENPIASPLVSTWYAVEVTSPDGCAKIVDSVFIDIVPPPVTNILPGVSTICLGATLNFDLQGGLGTNFTYLWSPSQDLSNDTIPNPLFTSSTIGTTTYTVTYTDTASDCVFDKSQIITVITNNLNPSALIDTSFCEGSSVNIDAGAGFASYQWSPTGGNGQFGLFGQPGNYTVVVSDGVCYDTSNVNVTQIDRPHPVILGDFILCPGETTTLSVNHTYANYTWGGGVSGSAPTISVPSTVNVVTVTVDSLGCTGIAVQPITELPTPSTTITGLDTVCPGESLTLSTSGGPFESYSWDPSGSQVASSTANSGVISVTISQDGCPFTTSATVFTHPNPVADFTISPEASGEPNVDILFTDASTNAASWLWDFDVTNLGSNPSMVAGQGPHIFVYDKQGSYTVSLSVTSEYDCPNSITKEYLIFSEIGTPNIITPNGDGKNDFLEFKSLDVTLFTNHITVLNRWGKKVFEQDNYNNNWNGDNLTEGTYFYVLSIDFNTGEEIYKGTLTILR